MHGDHYSDFSLPFCSWKRLHPLKTRKDGEPRRPRTPLAAALHPQPGGSKLQMMRSVDKGADLNVFPQTPPMQLVCLWAMRNQNFPSSENLLLFTDKIPALLLTLITTSLNRTSDLTRGFSSQMEATTVKTLATRSTVMILSRSRPSSKSKNYPLHSELPNSLGLIKRKRDDPFLQTFAKIKSTALTSRCHFP